LETLLDPNNPNHLEGANQNKRKISNQVRSKCHSSTGTGIDTGSGDSPLCEHSELSEPEKEFRRIAEKYVVPDLSGYNFPRSARCSISVGSFETKVCIFIALF
jgi:hypothetical protein